MNSFGKFQVLIVKPWALKCLLCRDANIYYSFESVWTSCSFQCWKGKHFKSPTNQIRYSAGRCCAGSQESVSLQIHPMTFNAPACFSCLILTVALLILTSYLLFQTNTALKMKAFIVTNCSSLCLPALCGDLKQVA